MIFIKNFKKLILLGFLLAQHSRAFTSSSSSSSIKISIVPVVSYSDSDAQKLTIYKENKKNVEFICERIKLQVVVILALH